MELSFGGIIMNRTFIIAEAGVNHNGDINLAYKLIDAAVEAGVDAVKFQTFKTEKVLSKSVDKAVYQKNNTGNSENQFDMVKKLELSYDDFIKLNKYCEEKEIMFLSTPDDEESLNFLSDVIKVPFLKIGSGEITNIPFLKSFAKKNIPLILSTGMSNLTEVSKAVDTIYGEGFSNKLYLLHCTTNYPCPYDEVNLKAMQTLKEAFKVCVGYSDHTLGIEIPIAAVAMGAKVIEKHFTVDKTLNGPDHKASLDPNELKEMVKAIRNVEKSIGDGIKKPNKSEIEIRKVVRRVLVSSKDIYKGSKFDMNSFEIKRANSGILPEYIDILIGKTIIKDIKKDIAFKWEDFLR
ncbi:MAG: N,N-diacetyllegionaminate synthase [Oceanotoga sp.]|nr:N,N-diacetyllegionaminate synthase [Oceanotoga sp.]